MVREGLNSKCIASHYYGAFIATENLNNNYSYQLQYESAGLSSDASLFARDQGDHPWTSQYDGTSNILTIADQVNRNELIAGSDFNFNLGNNTTLCPQEELVIDISDQVEGLKWNDGFEGEKKTISKSGVYWAEVSTYCGLYRDSIEIHFEANPQELDLGRDTTVCFYEPFVIKSNVQGTYLWQDGSTDSTMFAETPGQYFLTVSTRCTVQSDTIEINGYIPENSILPNVITPNNDDKNQYFQIGHVFQSATLEIFNRWGKKVYESQNYPNNWHGQGLTSGVYYYSIFDHCSKQLFRGTIKILR